MHSDTDRLRDGPDDPASGEAPEVSAMGSAEQIRRHLLASRGLCAADSSVIAIIDAHLVVMGAAGTEQPPRPAGRNL